MTRIATVFPFFLTLAIAAQAVEPGVGKVVFVDGVETTCEVLFEHPNAKVLVVRSADHRTAQSFPLSVVHAVTVAGKTAVYSPKRALTADEQTERERNCLWGDEVTLKQIGNYGREKWEKKPLIVWAKPGESGDGFAAESWLDERGKPLEKSPWGQDDCERSRQGRPSPETDAPDRIFFDGDVLLPAAGTKYEALTSGKGLHCIRHLTVERNASYRIPATLVGNLWVKAGVSGMWGSGGITRLGGRSYSGSGVAGHDKHTFLRFCNYQLDDPANNHDTRPEELSRYNVPEDTHWAYVGAIGHYVWIDPGPNGGSVEVIGVSGGAGDRLDIVRGTVVVSEDSYIGNGDRAAVFVHPGATAILLNGARIGHCSPLMGGSAQKLMATYGIAGTLMFGAPEHPLTRDLVFDACYYPQDRINPQGRPSQRASGASFILGETGRMVVNSADPTKARVVFRPRSGQLPVSQYNVPGDTWKSVNRVRRVYYAPKPELWEDPRVAKGVAAIFRGETDFNGVVFDGFYKGGVFVNPEARAKWKNVSFGDKNLGKPDELFAAP
jgi:hypothetical protein